ncbi:B3 domain-containing protein [Sesamum alatum]|uniref:B3 domain-containing protein n=1 Tax=Sesamum alatum TaxID=300844 RepID=A0AAE1YWT4_9LAMI|nr:B3 domain-containing protein [Sesamum alatum]
MASNYMPHDFHGVADDIVYCNSCADPTKRMVLKADRDEAHRVAYVKVTLYIKHLLTCDYEITHYLSLISVCADNGMSLTNNMNRLFCAAISYEQIRLFEIPKFGRIPSLFMDEERKDCLIAYVPDRNSNVPFQKRKRKNSFMIMKEFMGIKETHTRKRDSHDMASEARSCRRKRAIKNNLHFQVEITSSVMKRAEEIQANLGTQFPSFVKPMIRSNVRGGFWLSLPRLFCKLHLPSCDIKITLVDESNKEYYTKYLPERRGLSAGWRGFSISHNLEEGDILVFHLVGVCKMKVYIVRANHFSAVDAALSLLHLQACADVVNHEHVKEKGRTSLQVPEKLLRPPSQEMLCSNFKKFEQSLKSRPVMNDSWNISKNIVCFRRCGLYYTS